MSTLSIREAIDSIKKINKEYKEKRSKEYRKEVIICECGLTYTRGHKSDHYKTKIHRNKIKEN
jgi:arabinogalactan endo-1,4-beta-galactosidase